MSPTPLFLNDMRTVILLGLLWTLLNSCILSSPIEVEPRETNYPPLIELSGITPPDNPLIITEERYTEDFDIVVPLKDPNAEDELYYRWLTDQNGLELDGSTNISDESESTSTQFRSFTPVEFVFDPCSKIEGNGLVLHLLVSDAPFRSSGGNPEAFQPRGGAFIDAYTWKITTAPGVCEQ